MPAPSPQPIYAHPPQGRVLVTGAAGFIGFHTVRRLVQQGWQVDGLDNLDRRTGTRLKYERLRVLEQSDAFRFHLADLTDRGALGRAFATGNYQRVIHLAAQVGVRRSVDDPHAYLEANLHGFLNLLEACREARIEHLVYASSSSVYGAVDGASSETHAADHPESFYAATKRSNELMAHAYSALHRVPCSGLRFFTVYGPWGRPDMAVWRFVDAALKGRPVQLYSHGDMLRDFTYVDDVVESLLRVFDQPPLDQSGAGAPWRLINVGGGHPVPLSDLVRAVEKHTGRPLITEMSPDQAGDVKVTSCDPVALHKLTGFVPEVTLDEGVGRFVDWYREFSAVAQPLSATAS